MRAARCAVAVTAWMLGLGCGGAVVPPAAPTTGSGATTAAQGAATSGSGSSTGASGATTSSSSAAASTTSTSGSTSSATGGTGGSTSGGSSSGGSTGSTPLNPGVAPGGNFDLSVWALQLPVCSSGSVTTIPPAQLVGPSGFQDAYFYTASADGAMVLMDPPTGCTTSGSLHPRTELREMNSSGAKASWSTAGTNILEVTERVSQVPDHVSVGQIFQAPPYPSKPLLELEYHHDGTFVLLLENTNQGGNATFHPLGAVPPGSTYSYALALSGSTISVTINGVVSQFPLPSTFVGESFYFKAGDYDQTATAGTPGTAPGTVVEILALNVTHR